MLIDITIENFRSFENQVVFSMAAGPRLTKYKETNTFISKKIRLLKSAYIFGGNANGKTNVLYAFALLKQLVAIPTVSEVQSLMTDTFANNEKDSSFTLRFIKDGNLYVYYLKYNKNEVTEESLTVDSRVCFERIKQEFKVVPKSIAKSMSQVRKNQLLLFFAQMNNVTEAKNAFSWIVSDVTIINKNVDINAKPFIPFFGDETNKEKMLIFLRAADFNIYDIELRERLQPQQKVTINQDVNGEISTSIQTVDEKVTDIYLAHKNREGKLFWLHYKEESAGTKLFFLIVATIFMNQGREALFLIDEFDAPLHIKLTEVALRLFNEWNSTSQFVVTTHEFSLMDLSLRPDQIWFVEKDRFGCSELYSIFDFDSPDCRRQDYGYKKRYLQGVYGADQIINYPMLEDVLGVNYECAKSEAKSNG